MGKLIVIDPGHSGVDPGAVGPTGVRESDVGLRMAYKLKAILMRAGHSVILTRETWEDAKTDDLQYRVDISNNYAATAFISIHANAAENPEARGAEIWTTPGQTKADALAESILGEYEKQLPGLFLRKDLQDGDGDKEARFYVIQHTEAPAVLIETGFITNPEEEAQLNTDEYQMRLMQATGDGILAWLGA